MPSDAALHAELTALIIRLVDAGADDVEIEAAAASTGVDPVELAVVETLGDSLERAVDPAVRKERVRQHRRWLRRAAESGQTWALASGGLRWRHYGSEEEAGAGDPRDDHVTVEEGQAWLLRAAGAGHRLAALASVELAPDDDAALGLLMTAYGDGRDGGTLLGAGVIAREHVRAAAAAIAERYARPEDDRAELWFRRSLEGPPWDDVEITGLSSSGTSWLYAQWSHRRGRDDVCAAWTLRLAQDAADHGLADRLVIAEEAHKPYRDDYRTASVAEAVRRQALRHLLDEHAHVGDDATEVLRVLSDTHGFGRDDVDEDRERVARTLRGTYGRAVPVGVLGARVDWRLADLDRPLGQVHAWELCRWLATDAVPTVLEQVGVRDASADFRQALRAATDLPGPESWTPLGDTAAFAELSRRCAERPQRASARELDQVHMLLERAGLGAARPLFRSTAHPKVEHESELWRPLRRTDAWLGMWMVTQESETRPQPGSWATHWDESGQCLARVAQTAFRILLAAHVPDDPGRAGGRPEVASPLPSAVREQWSAAGEALRHSLAALVVEMSAW